ncbi:MAG TPA: SDR family NAD(P)-dependent oxidoreductase [Sedimentisphaerales bacterium]|nr:SDR family NAD(P)-dependent oxidoreductase [Sedimentisphaerales bacterium]
MKERLDGKIAIVTGSGQGIGKAVALRLAEEGANVVAVDINSQTAERTAEEIRALNRRALSYSIDVANVTEIQAMIDNAVAEFGRIDILVNAAGVAQTGLFLDLTEQQWDHVVDTNLKGTTFCIQAVGRQMIRQVPEEVKNNRARRSQLREDCKLFLNLRSARQSRTSAVRSEQSRHYQHHTVRGSGLCTV